MSDGRLRLSILDHTPVSSGSLLGDAFWHSTKVAQLAERTGYERYWVAEHHNMPWLASSTPAVLAAHVAARTSTLRVGTGGLMLSNYSPLSTVEQMGLLEVLHPGRIDLGLGRSSGANQITSHALQPDHKEFRQLFAELLAFFQGDFPDGHPYGSIITTPGRGNMPAIWLLGSGSYSAQLAGSLGLPFAHGGHFMGSNSVQAIETYHQAFRPSETLEEPYAIVSVGTICMETDELAQRYHNAARISMVRAMSGEPGPLLSPEEIEATPDGPWDPAQDDYVSEVFSHHIVGSPATVKAGLEDLAKRTGANELMIATIMHGYENRLRSYELTAEACLTGNPA
ncbi:LLM class flavin-dependent oxidoreductase [Streptomyces sp. NPDC056653]|uniref:LLM class flavin-dependent oxidoreductase n=1 Tax=Streptomyces sp. NPDC056653 TaxID=3345894 RepID=UPI003678D700